MRRVFKTVGILLVLVALFFVFEKIWANRQWFLEGRITKHILVVIVIGSFIYALSSFLLSTAWGRFLVWLGASNKTIKYAHAIYARTQIAKYVPGNVFHYAGRHVLGSRVGIGHGPLAGAAIYEIAGLLVASSSLAIIGIVFYGGNQTKTSVLSLSLIFFITLVVPVILNKVIIKFPKLRSFNFQDKRINEIIMGLVPTYLLYAVFFLISGGVLFEVVHAVSDIANIRQLGYVITTFAVSWIAGNVTPGASAGVGIREAIMVVSFTNLFGEPQSIFIALIFRMITVMGDFIYFLTSFAVRLDFVGMEAGNSGHLTKNDFN